VLSGKTVVGTAEPVSPRGNFQSFGGVLDKSSVDRRPKKVEYLFFIPE